MKNLGMTSMETRNAHGAYLQASTHIFNIHINQSFKQLALINI